MRSVFNTGKNPKLPYYLRNIVRQLEPRAWFRHRLPALLDEASERPDFNEIKERVNRYCQLPPGTPLPPSSPTLAQHRPGKQKVYFYDSYEYTRYFSPALRWNLAQGDAVGPQQAPTVAKCRPTAPGQGDMTTLLNLDKVRHFIFLDDPTPWEKKAPTAIFRGRCGFNPSRHAIMERYLHSARVDAGDVSRPSRSIVPAEWLKPKLTLWQHLGHKFILCPEGNDVASNLKWVMSTNTLAVMPRPQWETWFMEGTLEPGRHYVEVAPDFSDLEERMDYYLSRPALAAEIIAEAHRHVARFRDPRRELLTSLLTLTKYFRNTSQI